MSAANAKEAVAVAIPPGGSSGNSDSTAAPTSTSASSSSSSKPQGAAGRRRKSKNPRGLSLSLLTPLSPPPDSDSSAQSETSPLHQLRRQLDGMNLDDQQRARFEEFIFNKDKFLDVRELKSEDFLQLKVLGAGNGGVVWKVKHKQTGLVLARKMIHLEIKPKIREQILRELKVLHECNSWEIVGFYGSFFSDGEINILMEFMDGGSLDLVLRRVGRIPEDVVAQICLSMLRGLIYLRDNFKIIHRDIKPSNVLVNSQGEVKLCDFGVSGELTSSLANTFVGTRSYMAPERLLGNKYAIESDIWSLGLSLVEMAVGMFPIPAEEGCNEPMAFRKPSAQVTEEKKKPTMAIFELLAHIVEGPPPRLPKGHFTPDFEDFVAKCLVKTPEERPSLKQLMEHTWIQRAIATEVDMAAWAKSTMPSAQADI